MKFLTVAILFFLASIRFVNLLNIPIFIDEQTYLKLGANSLRDSNQYFASLKYLVFPVVPWILAVFEFIFPKINPLLLGRVIMVIADLLSAFFVYKIAKTVINQKYGIFSVLVYLLLPLNFFHSRVILLEPLTNSFFLIGLYFYLKNFVCSNKKKGAQPGFKYISTTAALTLSFLSKPLAIVCFCSLPIFTIANILNQKGKLPKNIFVKLAAPFLIFTAVFVISLPLINIVWQGFSDYRAPFNIFGLLINLKNNLWLTFWWLKVYLTPPILGVISAAIFYAALKREWYIIGIAVWLGVIIFLENLIGTNFLPRHLYLVAAPTALLAGYILYSIWIKTNNLARIAVVIAVLSVPVLSIFRMLSNPYVANLALEDKQQFFTDWTSGQGLALLASDLKQLPKDRDILIFSEAEVGFGWALKNIYQIPGVVVIDTNLMDVSYKSINLASVKPQGDFDQYLLLNRNTEPPSTWNIRLVKSYQKLPGLRLLKLYKYDGE